MSDFSQLPAELQAHKAAGLYRSRRVIESPQGIHLQVNGRSLLNFCSSFKFRRGVSEQEGVDHESG